MCAVYAVYVDDDVCAVYAVCPVCDDDVCAQERPRSVYAVCPVCDDTPVCQMSGALQAAKTH